MLETLWRQPHLDVRQVRELLSTDVAHRRTPGLKTVQSALERLFRKEYVGRVKQGHAYTYYASVSRGNLLGRMLGDVIQLLHDGRMDTILSSFVQAAADLDESSLNEPEALIRRRKSQLADSEGSSQERSALQPIGCRRGDLLDD